MATSNNKKKIKLSNLMEALEQKLVNTPLLLVLRSASLGQDLDADASEDVIKHIRQRLDDCLAEPSDDTTVTTQIEEMSQFLKQYEQHAKSKLTPDNFKVAVAQHLSKIPLGELFIGSKLEYDKEGNLQPHVIENIKIVLDKAIDMTPDENAKSSMEAMRAFMENYE